MSSCESDRPFVMRDIVSKWKVSNWTPATVAKLLSKKTVKFRLGRKNYQYVQFETECLYEEGSMEDFCEWLEYKPKENALESRNTNPLFRYRSDEYFCYADYKYMAELFAEIPSILEEVDWTQCGLDATKSKDSTFWMGSAGSNTVCHYDTYGCNLVAQIYGRKRWVLFPPEGSKYLYPTRIPYEESSVFSQVNILHPDLNKFPNYQKATPYVVVLEPGDLLFVPRHWWHYVESLETSISVNTWVELPEDSEERLKEAVTRTLLHSILSDSPAQQWLNPNEVQSDLPTNLQLLNNSVQEINRKHYQNTSANVNISAKTTVTTISASQKRKHNSDFESSEETYKRNETLEQGFEDLVENENKRQKKNDHYPLKSIPDNNKVFVKKISFQELLTLPSHKQFTKDGQSISPSKTNSTSVDNSLSKSSSMVAKPDLSVEDANNGSMDHGLRLTWDLSPIDFANCVVNSDVVNLICTKVKEKSIANKKS